MPYTLVRSGSVLTALVTDPTPADLPRGLADIQRCLDGGGISEVQVGFDQASWDTAWARHALTSFETSMKDLGVPVRVLGEDARLELKSR